MKYIALKFQNGNKALKMNDIICISRLLRLPDNFFVLHSQNAEIMYICLFMVKLHLI